MTTRVEFSFAPIVFEASHVYIPESAGVALAGKIEVRLVFARNCKVHVSILRQVSKYKRAPQPENQTFLVSQQHEHPLEKK